MLDARPGDALKGAMLGLGVGANAFFWGRFMFVGCENLRRFAENAWFSMHQGWQCAAPNQLPDVGPGSTPKGVSPGLGGGLNAIFCLVLGASCVGKCVAGVKQWWQWSVVLGVW